MARLTKAIKSKVLQSIIKAANEPQSALLLTQEHALAEHIYCQMIGLNMKHLKSLPKSFFDNRSSVAPKIMNEALSKAVIDKLCSHNTADLLYQSVQTHVPDPYDGKWGSDIYINTDASNRCSDIYVEFPGDCDRVVPHFMSYGFEIPKELHKRFIDQVTINVKHIDSLKALAIKTCNLLDSVTTTQALIKLWPGVDEYIPEADKKETLPAIRVKDVLDLIKCTQKAACSVAQIA